MMSGRFPIPGCDGGLQTGSKDDGGGSCCCRNYFNSVLGLLWQAKVWGRSIMRRVPSI